MAYVYRGMWSVLNSDPTTPLVEAQNANALGVRAGTDPNQKPPPDVITFSEAEQAWVGPRSPQPADKIQGMSVSKTPCNLPPHRRPKGAPWNGTNGGNGGKNPSVMFRLNTDSLPPSLAYHADPVADGPFKDPDHGVISAARVMTETDYENALAGTVALWEKAPNPATPCTVSTQVSAQEGSMEVDAQLGSLLQQVAAGTHPQTLISALVEANEGGVSGATLVASIERAVDTAEEAGNADGAEALRGVLDRIYGYCAASARITLH
ncbi:hypothetical protein [Micropruina sp.]|uniref:hypothetical protein n=1 Tax=Micropruina sp. TaxID=2737536 RepID=UPI00262576F0|nr:hypothetical protein [Micropruina sp.]